MQQYLNITAESLGELKKLYRKAIKDNASEFQFQGAALLVDYAKYLIEYLETQSFRHGAD